VQDTEEISLIHAGQEINRRPVQKEVFSWGSPWSNKRGPWKCR